VSKLNFRDDFAADTIPDLSEIGTPIHLEDFNAMGIDPRKSTRAKPGTEEKVQMLSARYAAGLALWHNSDRYDHGPKERDLMGALGELQPLPLPSPDSDFGS
jgi:hypothetical protein